MKHVSCGTSIYVLERMSNKPIICTDEWVATFTSGADEHWWERMDQGMTLSPIARGCWCSCSRRQARRRGRQPSPVPSSPPRCSGIPRGAYRADEIGRECTLTKVWYIDQKLKTHRSPTYMHPLAAFWDARIRLPLARSKQGPTTPYVCLASHPVYPKQQIWPSILGKLQIVGQGDDFLPACPLKLGQAFKSSSDLVAQQKFARPWQPLRNRCFAYLARAHVIPQPLLQNRQQQQQPWNRQAIWPRTTTRWRGGMGHGQIWASR